MAGDDDQKKDDSTTPADDIPEVDAEIVVDEPAAAAEPFDDAEASETEPAARPSFVSPGVLFFAGMVVVAIAAGAVWYFTTGLKTEPVVDETTVQAPAAAPETEAVAAEPDTKIANEALADVKPGAPAPSEASSFADDIAALSTPSDAIANTDMQTAAKEAADIESDAPDVEAASEEIPPAISFDLEGAAPTGEESIEDAPPARDDAANDNQPTDEIPDEPRLDVVDAPSGEERVADAGDGVDGEAATVAADADGIASLEAALAEARRRASALEAAIEDARSELASANDALLETRARLATAQSEIADLSAQNDALRDAAKQSPVAAGAVALNGILKAVEEGAPFAAELATLRQAVPDAMGVVLLERYADGGAPTMTQIRGGFDAAARAGLATANRENANGVVERYGARVAGLFNIRPAAPQAGDAPGAVISRAEDAVDKGALSRAIDEIQALPPAAQEAMSDWVDLARQRAEIDAALRSLNADLAERAAGPESL